ncbi:MAG: O-antigen ligase family protein [Candidatus Sumerlaeota bacterium]|nr:O-antigen ligase family protein [Candidatus Sumerlaeota bacterium]
MNCSLAPQPATGSPSAARSPFPASWRTGEFFFWLIIATMCLPPLALGVSVGEYNVQALGWIIALLGAGGCLLFCPCRTIAFPVWSFAPFFIYAFARMNISDRISVQQVLMMLTPMLVGTVASALAYRDLRFIQRGYLLLLAFHAVFTIRYALFATREFAEFATVGAVMTYVLIAVGALVSWRKTGLKSLAAYGLCVAVCVMTVSRIELATLIFLPFIILLNKGRIFTANKALWALAAFLAFYIFFYLPPVQKALFYSGSGTLTQTISDVAHLDYSRLQTTGRLNTWKHFLNDAKDPWLGAGAGASYWYGMKAVRLAHPHNEYIRMFYDYGIAGSLLLAVPLMGLWALCHRRAREGPDELRWLYSVSSIGIIIAFLIALTDNILMYASFYGDLLFFTIGAACATTARMKQSPPQPQANPGLE